MDQTNVLNPMPYTSFSRDGCDKEPFLLSQPLLVIDFGWPLVYQLRFQNDDPSLSHQKKCSNQKNIVINISYIYSCFFPVIFSERPHVVSVFQDLWTKWLANVTNQSREKPSWKGKSLHKLGDYSLFMRHWLVVYLPLSKIMEFVRWDDSSQYMEQQKMFQTTSQLDD